MSLKACIKYSLSILATSAFNLAILGTSHAQNFNECQQQFYRNTAPEIKEVRLKRAIYPLCFNGFAVLYSGVSYTPLWSAEYLTPQVLQQAKNLSRRKDFHEEERVPDRYRSYLADYAGSGYNRGQMIPDQDMATHVQQHDSFSLANVVPQSPKNNQEVWRSLEAATRALVTKQQKSAYVITGPAFLSSELKQIGRVLVPTHVYKVVYFPDLGVASAYFAPNNESGEVNVVSVQELENKIGINLMPEMPARIKAKRIMLPFSVQQVSRSIQSWGGQISTGRGITASSSSPKNGDHSWVNMFIEKIKP